MLFDEMTRAKPLFTNYISEQIFGVVTHAFWSFVKLHSQLAHRMSCRLTPCLNPEILSLQEGPILHLTPLQRWQ
jgi:hypothetical protein